jgi:glycosyltransferase involved in cell wall biosynthesis
VTRVAFVVPSLYGGGAERAAVTVLNALDRSRYQRTLYMFRREGPYLKDVAPEVDVVAAAGDDRIGRVRQLARFIGERRPDIVVSFLSYFSAFLAVRLARSGARFVINQQTPVSAFLADRDYAWRRPLRRAAFARVARLVYPRADAVVATSTGVGADLTSHYGVRPEAIATIPNPFDLDAIARAAAEPVTIAAPADVPLIVSAGRLADAKNWPLLIDALRLLKGRRPAHTLILGQGELEGEIRRRIAEAGLSDDVTLCGFQANPWKFMARADVFVLTSHYEGFGNVLVEAMACGAPVVATASPGTRAIVNSEADGLLVEQHDSAAVAGALDRVLSDAAFRARLSAAAHERARAFAVGAVADAYDRLFQRLAGAAA